MPFIPIEIQKERQWKSIFLFLILFGMYYLGFLVLGKIIIVWLGLGLESTYSIPGWRFFLSYVSDCAGSGCLSSLFRYPWRGRPYSLDPQSKRPRTPWTGIISNTSILFKKSKSRPAEEKYAPS